MQSLLSLLVLGGCLLAAAQRDKEAAGNAPQVALVSPGGSSGRFVSPEQHECSWKLLLRSPGTAAGSELALSCQGPDGARYQCAYHAEPEGCAAYASRGAHYWKLVLGRLRKKRLPCHDPARFRARMCSDKKGQSAQLRPGPRASPPTSPVAVGFPGKPKPRARGRGRPRESVPGPAAGAPAPASMPSKEKLSEKKTKGGKRKGILSPDAERPIGTGQDFDRLDKNAELTETYCAEKWHSICNFFVNFWNG